MTLTVLALINLISFAAPAMAVDFAVGTRVLVKGHFHRKCSARVESTPSLGFFRLSFDKPGCGDASIPYESRQLQKLHFLVDGKRGSLKSGDHVVLKGFHSRQ